ncbi:MAG: hypothetical protein AB8B84_10395 [Granulosicoccus sp.]
MNHFSARKDALPVHANLARISRIFVLVKCISCAREEVLFMVPLESKELQTDQKSVRTFKPLTVRSHYL